MKITDVKAMTLKGYKQWNYVQIETDAGLTRGWRYRTNYPGNAPW